MMPQLQKGKSRTLQIYCIDFSLLKLSPPAIRRHYTTTFVPLSLSLDHTNPKMKTPRKGVAFLAFFTLRALHHIEEVIIRLGHCQLIDEEFHRINLTHRMDNFAQDPHFLQLFLSGKQLFFTGTGTVVVDSREDGYRPPRRYVPHQRNASDGAGRWRPHHRSTLYRKPEPRCCRHAPDG